MWLQPSTIITFSCMFMLDLLFQCCSVESNQLVTVIRYIDLVLGTFSNSVTAPILIYNISHLCYVDSLKKW